MTTLETARLVLRPLTAAHTESLLAYRGDPEVCRYLPFPPMDAAEIARRLETQWFRTELAEDGEHVTLGAELRDTGQLVGDVILFLKSREHGNGEIGWVFHPAVAGQGYATEAAAAMLDWAFGALDGGGVDLRRVVEVAGALRRHLRVVGEDDRGGQQDVSGRVLVLPGFARLAAEDGKGELVAAGGRMGP